MMTLQEFANFLDDISRCLIEDNFQIWRSRVLLPYSMLRADGIEEFHTEEDLRTAFSGFVEACKIGNIDEIIRRPLKLEDCGDGLWLGTYETNLLSRGRRTMDPFESTVLLHPLAEGARASSVYNSSLLRAVMGLRK